MIQCRCCRQAEERSDSTAAVAREIANTGYRAAERRHFHGVRRHFIASRRVSDQTRAAEARLIRQASARDLASVKEQQICLSNTTLFGDKAFCDKTLELEFKRQNTPLLVPKRNPK